MLNGTNFKVWKEAVKIVLSCMDLDLALQVEEPIPTMDNLQENQSASRFFEEIEQFFVKNEKVEMGNLLAKLISIKYKGRGNIKEYIMEMSNLAAKLKSLKLELDEDLIIYLVSISLPAHFGKFKRKRGCREIRLKMLIFLRPLRIRKGRTLRVLQKGLLKERNQRKIRNLPTSSGCLWSRLPSDDERFIFMGNGNKVVIEAIGTFILQLKIKFHLDLCEPSLRKNLIFISSSDKFGFFHSFGNNKVNLYQNSNVVGYGSLIDNLYMHDVFSSYNEILQIGSRDIKRKLIENSRIERLVLDEILEPLDLSNFKFYVECIKGKRTNIRKLGAKRAKDVLELIHTDICGPFPTVSWTGQQYFATSIDDYSRYNVFKYFKAEVELQLGKKIKALKFGRGCKYYGRYDGSGEQHLKPFALFLRECEIVPQYIMPGKPSMNSVAERRNQTLKDMSLWGEALKTAIYILNRVPPKVVNKTLMKFGLTKSQTSNTYTFGVVQLKHDLIGCMKENWIQEQLAIILLFYDPTSRSLFETGNARILEEVEFEKEENIRNIVFEEESINDIEQDYDKVLPQIPIEKLQQPQEVTLRKSIRERRHAILDDYIVFLQERSHFHFLAHIIL
ncbi:hypothetical protein CR513_11976, partial [Mucuna pruriens]